VPEGIRKLLGTLPLPGFVESRCFDVLASYALPVHDGELQPGSTAHN